MSSKGRIAMAVVAAGVAGLGGWWTNGSTAWSFENGPRPFKSIIHQRITRNALPFLEGGILEAIVDGNNHQDDFETFKNLCAHHGCNCLFQESADYYNQQYRGVIARLIYPQAAYSNSAPDIFGSLSHGVQDFYSHSNWVATPPQGLGIQDRLLDTGLGPWAVLKPYSILFDDVVVIEGEPPADVTTWLPVDGAGRVSSAVPIVEDRRVIASPSAPSAPSANAGVTGPVATLGRAEATPTGINASPDIRLARPARGVIVPPTGFARRYRGLMTAGSVTDDARSLQSQHCPPVGTDCKSPRAKNDVCLRHNDGRGPNTRHFVPGCNWNGHVCVPVLGPIVRSFDDIGHMNMDADGEGDWEKARHLAKRQTEHEWCRLLHLTRAQDPTHQAAGRLLGHWVKPNASPHIPGTACAQQVTRQHLVAVSGTPGAAAPDEVRFVLFRGDFTNSARATLRRGQTTTLSFCANENEDVVAALVPRASQSTALAVKVSSATTLRTVTKHGRQFEATFIVKVTPNGCGTIF